MCKRFMRTLAMGISSILCVLCLGTSASAQTLPEDALIQQETYDEVVNVDELIALGLEQLAARPQVMALENGDEATVLEVSQLLSRTVYADGTVMEEYCNSGIVVLDENNVAIPIRELASYVDAPVSGQDTASLNGIVLVVNAYATCRIDGAYSITFRLDRMVSYVHNENHSTTPPTRVENVYVHMLYPGVTANNVKYLDASTKLQSSTLVSQHTGFMESRDKWSGWQCQGQVFLSDGNSITAEVDINVSNKGVNL